MAWYRISAWQILYMNMRWTTAIHRAVHECSNLSRFRSICLFLTTRYQCHEFLVLILGLTVTSGERLCVGGRGAGQFSENGQKLFVHRKPELLGPTSHKKKNGRLASGSECSQRTSIITGTSFSHAQNEKKYAKWVALLSWTSPVPAQIWRPCRSTKPWTTHTHTHTNYYVRPIKQGINIALKGGIVFR